VTIAQTALLAHYNARFQPGAVQARHWLTATISRLEKRLLNPAAQPVPIFGGAEARRFEGRHVGASSTIDHHLYPDANRGSA
jgi:hypothetical protein